MRRILFAAAVLSWAASSAHAQWCDKDCESLCRATAGRGWQGGNVAACVQHFNGPQYAGHPCAGPARVAARAKQINSGGGPRNFNECLQRGVKAGWGAAETNAYCSRHGYK